MSWSASNLPIRPGVYERFRDNAEVMPQGGPRGIVAIPLLSYGGDVDSGKFYTVERVTEAADKFGADNVTSIRAAFQGGASQVVVYTVPQASGGEDGEEGGSSGVNYDAVIDALETEPFNVLTLDRVADKELQQELALAVDNWKGEGKHVWFVAGIDEDMDGINTFSEQLDDDYVINIGPGLVRGENDLTPSELAPYVAGLVAGNPLNQTLTFAQVLADDVTKRLRNAQVIEALEAGTFTFVKDGAQVKVEKGIATSGAFVRSVSARHTVLNDLPAILRENVVAQLDNTEEGRMTAITMMLRYLETLEQENIIQDADVYVDPENPPQKDVAFFVVDYTDVYSMERVMLTVSRQG
ncbi:hypothetical protein JCM19037_1561 [Geomicrobium sp. JCM 19037]|uniref:phage tail sheath subtilisin-like domain-containing protein n=1 Tax=Geomicrobium sp. JCM 19037 TaxID=1460634 RepID=UPI00045F4A78|nr:phage tail sheath subtilisin-like domain-containing protein [Geomicrobium sp. JCM 19037]GAK03254.1 hypothetical protein JCM19037_1561 [Geomicrobium sp. JCM 19037]